MLDVFIDIVDFNVLFVFMFFDFVWLFYWNLFNAGDVCIVVMVVEVLEGLGFVKGFVEGFGFNDCLIVICYFMVWID